jgi:para-nitrobenzyl esterase
MTVHEWESRMEAAGAESRQNSVTRRGFLSMAAWATAALAMPAAWAQGAPEPEAGAVTLRTPLGPLTGEQSNGVRIFRGVPFAQPPVGPLRFRAPEPLKPWTAPRAATRFAAAAIQSGEPGVEHSEDCLYLNLWAPAGKGPFPVFVWIHGGGFTGGHAFEPMYDGAGLASQGVICVTVAYRLGVLGFLDLEPLLGPAYAGSANTALRDLLAALDWVQKNIEAFGGDPRRVTVGGESAGAKLTGILMGVPEASPLFSQMISESGGAERVSTRQQAAAVAEGFGASWRRASGLETAALATARPELLMEAQREFLASWPAHFPLRCELDGALLPRRPVETIAAGSTKGKRLLIGTNRDESALFLGPHPQHDAGAADLGNLSADKFAAVYAKYAEVYPEMSEERRRIRAVTAEEYWVPTMREADAHLRGGGQAYAYRLDFSETSGWMKGYAFHSLDVPLVWDRPHAAVANAAAEAVLAARMQQAWVAFIRDGKPAASGLPAWPEYDAAARPTMVLDAESRVEQKPQEAELRLWDGLL